MAVELDGIWAPDARITLDDSAAKAAGNVNQHGQAAIHGTYTRFHYFVVRMESDGGLTVFDDTGAAASFVKGDGANHWESHQHALVYEVPRSKRIVTIDADLILGVESTATVQNPHAAELHIGPAADGEAVTGQHLVYAPGPDTFTWSSDAVPGRSLTFSRITAQIGDPTNQRFGDPFVSQSHYAQTDFPYYGFDPRYIDLYSGSGVTTTGSSGTGAAHALKPGEGFIAPLIFAFPDADSRDYVKFSVMDEQVNLPIGRIPIPLNEKTETRSSHMISSVEDRMESWAVTLGFSAGVPEILSVEAEGTYKQKIEDHTENQSRYAINRSVTRTWANLMHAPSLQLDKEYVAWITQAAHDLLSGSDPNWEAFTKHFGTHYVHAMTQGTITYAETRMSLASESHAFSNGVDASVSASGAFDGIDVGGKAKYQADWSSKFGTTLEDEDVTMFSFGEGSPAGLGIFYDLRPMSELFSPIFFPYSGDDWGRMAPLVWTDLRQSFEGYLAILGYGSAVPENLKKDFTPRVIRFSIDKLTATMVDAHGNVAGEIGYFRGPIRFEGLDGGTANDKEKQAEIRSKDYSPDAKVTSPVTPSADDGYGLVVIRPNVTPSFTLHVDGFTPYGNVTPTTVGHGGNAVSVGYQTLGFPMQGSFRLEIPLGDASEATHALSAPLTATTDGFTANLAVSIRVEDLGPVSEQTYKNIAAGNVS